MDCTQAEAFALAHWLVNGADGGRLFVRCFGGDGTVRENVAGDVLASLTTLLWNALSKSWTGGATMADASLNRRMTVRLGDAVAFAQIGIVGLDGQIELEALRLFNLLVAAPALLCGTPTLPVGRRGFPIETSFDRPSLTAGAVHLVDVAVPDARQGDPASRRTARSPRVRSAGTPQASRAGLRRRWCCPPSLAGLRHYADRLLQPHKSWRPGKAAELLLSPERGRRPVLTPT